MFIENTTSNIIRYANIKAYDVANGPGVRVSLYVQGCPHHCPNCFNPETWDYEGGNVLTNDIMTKIIEDCKKPQISGLSILGGEPFAQNLILLNQFIEKYKEEVDKPIWVWTGYLYEDLIQNKNALNIIKNIDTLVDGPFIESKKDLKLDYRGSSNQRVIYINKSLLEEFEKTHF